MAETQELLCDACGAPLEVGPKARFVTCGYCDARLRVKHSESAAWTEKVERIAKKQKTLEKRQRRMAAKQRRLERELAVSKLRDDLEELEREWDREREGYMVRQKSGALLPPDRVLRQMIWVTVALVPLLVVFAATQLGAIGC